MAKREVNITLRSSGAGKVVDDFGKIGSASRDLIVNVKKIGNVFGELGGNIGGFIQNILKGGVWGIVASIAENVMGLFGKWLDGQKEINKELEKLAETAKKAGKAATDCFKEIENSCIDSMSALVLATPTGVPSSKRPM